jgi:hypothetical protein
MIRRRYRKGRRCQDCGRSRPTTIITFWSSGYRYIVCGECIRPYRSMILSGTHLRAASGLDIER